MNLLRFTLVCLFLVVPLVAVAEKAKTIDELAAMYDSTTCKDCHVEIYAQWEKSHHARSLMGVKGGMFLTPLAMKKKTVFSPADPKKATMKNFPCLKCHLPQALTSAEDSVAVELTEALLAQNKAKVSKLKITCLVCHNEKAIIHRLQDGKPDKTTVYGKKDVAEHLDKKYKKVKKSVILKESVFCGQCHGLGPNFDAENPYQCANLYGSYLHAYIPGGGTQTCQDCHMKPINGKADHLIAPNWNDIKQSSALLREAISLDVQTLGYEWLQKAKTLIPIVVVNTKIKTNAGHRIPDG